MRSHYRDREQPYAKLSYKGEAHSFHMNVPANDLGPGKFDDWEVRSVIKGNRMARKFDSPAVPRYEALQAAQLAKQLAQLDAQASMAVARSALMGPLGAVSAAMTAGMTAMAHAQGAAALKQAHDFFTWQCSDAPAGASAKRDPASVQLTDLTDLGPQTIDGVAGSGYQFYVKENGRFNGPVRVLVARDSGMPRRFEFADRRGGGKMTMNYSDFDKPEKIDMPSCLAGK